MKKDDVELSALFPVHARLDILQGRDTFPPEIVAKVALFVLDFERAAQTGPMHGDILSHAIEDYADGLIQKIETMSATLKGMDYHAGRRYKPTVARNALDLLQKCKDVQAFCNAEAYTTRDTPHELRRVFAHYRSEMKTTLPRVLNRIDLADQVYNIEKMSRFVRALSY